MKEAGSNIHMRIEESICNIKKVTNQLPAFEQVLNELYLCLVQGRSILESLEIIICSNRTPATVEQILHLLSSFTKIETKELIKKI